MSIRGLLYQLACVEDRQKLFKPEYLKMRDDADEAEALCNRCDHCREPDGYCDEVIARLDRKELLLSAANRLLHSMMEHGCIVSIDGVPSRQERCEVEFDWEEYGEKFCRHCVRRGTEKCPEDMCDDACVRHETAMGIEQVISAVNELV